MGFIVSLTFFMLFLLVTTSFVSSCDECIRSRAAFFHTSSGLLPGACGYGSLANKLYGGHTAAAIPSIYNDGIGCGSCFQIRCKHKDLCSVSGTKVVVTDIHSDKSNTTDFVLTSKGFRAMALIGKDKELMKVGIANVEYKRIPCIYKGQNLAIRVEEFSKFPNYLAIAILYQGGQTRISTIHVGTTDPLILPIVKTMKHNYGAVWDTDEAPAGPLGFKFDIIGGYEFFTEQVLPPNWKPGGIYNTSIQFDMVEPHGCAPCGSWK